MAFMGRGDMPSINNNIDGGENNNFDGGYRHHYGWYYRRYYYIPLDNTYVIMQMIVTFIILIIGIVAFLFIYKSDIVDPIESAKKLFINTHLIIIGVLLAITLIINFFSKSATTLIKRLAIVFGISIIIMLVFFGIKLNMDTTYNKDKFEQIYAEKNISEDISNKSKVDLSLTGFGIKTEKEYYIDECIKLYNIFKTKTYGTLGIHLLLNILLIYQISKIVNSEGKKDKLNKDDLILFDDEQNIKI